MGRITNFLDGRGRIRTWLDTSYRSATFGNVVADKLVEIVINRMETQGDPTTTTQFDTQYVRLDLLSGSVQENSLIAGLGTVNKQRVLITGYKNHPSEDDLDIQIEDTFPYEGQFYRVVKVEPTFTDRILAIGEADG